MKHRTIKRLCSILLTVAMVITLIPLSSFTVFAGHRCPNCDEWIDGSPYCEDCYECDECCDLCYECGKCTECSGNDLCAACSEDEGNICVECAIDKGRHCPNCDDCYLESLIWCVHCGGCGTCTDICGDCSENLGEDTICVECAVEKGSHCPECEGCYFASPGWCEECKRCFDCVEFCEYCSEEVGETICTECAIDEGLHCPDCNGCYGECEGYCEECGLCSNCVDICLNHDLCMDCAVSDGVHCPNCLACDQDADLCEDCGERCSECADAFCTNCNLCSDCVQICLGCGSCSNCADICPNCGEYCSDCDDICEDCGFCSVCCHDIAAFSGCDCQEWVCVESPDWSEHFAQYHTETSTHSARASVAWSWSASAHWHACLYCNDSEHYADWQAHTFNAKNVCTVCGYVKDAKIQITEQPKNSSYSVVRSPDEDYDESNMAHFSVKAVGEGELTYTWCRKMYSNGEWIYKPLTELFDPEPGENYEGPDLDILTFTDSCNDPMYLSCLISDTKGNQVRTVDVTLSAAHNYQYYSHYHSHKYPLSAVERSIYGHVLQCVGENCGKVTNLRPHEDEDQDGFCDICDYEVGTVLITEQPKNVSDVRVSSADEDYDKSNIAHFSVKAKGEGKLTYTWCRATYIAGKWNYQPLTNPGQGETYDGPDLYIVAPEDSCCMTYYYCCFITDETEHQSRSVIVSLNAKHNYQYYKYYKTHTMPYPGLKTGSAGHFLRCVGTDCGKTTRLCRHVDNDNDYCCDVCDYIKGIFEVDLTVTAPKEGQKPNYSVVSASPAYYAVGNANSTQYRRWYVSDNGTSGWALMDKDSTFASGKYYKFSVDVRTMKDREFATYNNAPNLWAKINGNYVLPTKMDGQEASHYITAECDFGLCNDSVIESIQAVGVTAPVAGEKPSYTYSILGSGYLMDSKKNRYRDDYEPWTILEEEREYYIKNGIGWFDLTKSDWVYEDETFIFGHEYTANLYLVAEDDFEFAHSKWNEPLVTASVNGFTATAALTGSECVNRQQVQYTFDCQQKSVSRVDLKLDTPRAGRTPADYSVTSLSPEYYVADKYGFGGAIWYDSNGEMLNGNDQFVQGAYYKVEIKLIPTKVDAANAASFVPPVSAYINDKQVTDQGGWDKVAATNSVVYVYYTFTDGALAPKSYANARVYGSITAFGADNKTGYVRIYAKDEPEPISEQEFTGKTGNYEFFVSHGEYVLEIAKSKHATRRYQITVSSDETQCDLTAWLYGDVTGDGLVNGTDAMQVNRYAAGKTSVFTQGDAALIAYRLLVGDVTKDTFVNGTDAIQVNRYAAGKTSVFDSIP